MMHEEIEKVVDRLFVEKSEVNGKFGVFGAKTNFCYGHWETRAEAESAAQKLTDLRRELVLSLLPCFMCEGVETRGCLFCAPVKMN